MSVVRDGVAASEGMAFGPIHRIHWTVPEVPHRMVEPEEVEGEVQRFHDAREWAKARLLELQEGTEHRMGLMEDRIFEPQIAMLDDVEVVDGTVRYIHENRLTAARAFEWRMLELQSRWVRSGSAMVLDRLNDLEDLQVRLLHRLLDLPEPANLTESHEPSIIVARSLTPTLTVQLDPDQILGIAADEGTRTSHWVILARSLSIPVVVGLGDVTREARDGQEGILDGRLGRVVLDPSSEERDTYRRRQDQLQEYKEELATLHDAESVTADGLPVALRANMDLPSEGERARANGADGVGLFRTEFLVVGRRTMPDEDDQYEAYKKVVEAFPHGAVFIRTFDLGGDKVPLFLPTPQEENPFLGWRGIRVCLDEVDLFRTQLRAILRAAHLGDVRMLLPMVNTVDEVLRVRELIAEEMEKLRAQGVPFQSGCKLGVLLETPAATLSAAELARHCDFFSVGTNDLVQYTLAVDRTNPRLRRLYNPFHPAVVRQLHQVARVARGAGIETSVCGEMAANPLGVFLLLGLDIHSLSVGWPSVPEVKRVIRQFRVEDARQAARKALSAGTASEVVEVLTEGIGSSVDLSAFSGRWRLSPLPESTKVKG